MHDRSSHPPRLRMMAENYVQHQIPDATGFSSVTLYTRKSAIDPMASSTQLKSAITG
jgi:hypothetical protein